jgi:hypothetical protein
MYTGGGIHMLMIQRLNMLGYMLEITCFILCVNNMCIPPPVKHICLKKLKYKVLDELISFIMEYI